VVFSPSPAADASFPKWLDAESGACMGMIDRSCEPVGIGAEGLLWILSVGGGFGHQRLRGMGGIWVRGGVVWFGERRRCVAREEDLKQVVVTFCRLDVACDGCGGTGRLVGRLRSMIISPYKVRR